MELNRPLRSLHLVVAAMVAGPACYSSTLDPTLSGVFACQQTEDCSEAQLCLEGRCVASDELPFVEIVRTDPPSPMPLDPIDQSFSVFARTNVSIEEDANESGLILRGFIAGTPVVAQARPADGDEVRFDFSFDPPARGRALKIAVEVLSADEEPLDTPGSRDRRVFFIDDGNPQVAVVDPWVDDEFPATRVPAIRVAIETLHFQLAPIDGGTEAPSGHVHVFQPNPASMQSFPIRCLFDRLDCGAESDFYTVKIPREPTQAFEDQISLNAAGSDARIANLPQNFIAVALSNDDHTSFEVDGRVVVDVVALRRTP